MSDPVILIHGAWQGSWSFDALRPALHDVGLRGVAVDLPGNGVDSTPPGAVTLDLCLDSLEATIDSVGGRAFVLGHSGGGLYATALAERSPERVSGVIYLAGMCLPNGEDFGQLQARVGGPVGISDDIVVAPDGLTSTVPTEEAIRYFLADCEPELAARLAGKLTPQPEGGRLITSPASAERFGRVPKLYIEAAQDRSISVAAQRAMQALVPDMPVVSLDTGHVPQVIDPEGVADAIVGFVRSVEDDSSPDERREQTTGTMSQPTVAAIDNCTPGLERSWFPVATSEEVTDQPISVRLLGEPWVVVRLADGLFAARDRCPHRLAPLSIGRVVDDTLQCKYHGWRFGLDGGCVRVPSAPATTKIPSRARATTPFGVAEHLGMVWIAPAEPVLGLPELPEWDEPGYDRIPTEPRRTSASAAQLMDNFVDASHFATVHVSTFGVPDKTEVDSGEVTTEGWTAATRYTTWYLNHDDPMVASGEHPLEQPHVVEKFAHPPFSVYMRLLFPMTEQVIAILYAMQPETADSTRIFKLMARNDFGGDPQLIADMLDFEDRVLDEDLEVLEAFPSNVLHLDRTVEVHVRADRLSLAYRRQLQRLVDTGTTDR